MNIVQGTLIAESMKEEIKNLASSAAPKRLGIFVVGENPVIEKFVEKKRTFGADVGVHVEVLRFPSDVREDELLAAIANATHDGIVVQLPLPAHLDRQKILDSIAPEQDVDVLGAREIERVFRRQTLRLPPVAAAVAEIFKSYDVDLAGKKIVVVGMGALVGKPVMLWLQREGFEADIVDKDTPDISERLLGADVIISGAGDPWFVRPEMVRQGSVLIDAGTSSSAGKLRGDIAPSCAEKAALYSGVPGGVGPITVAALFRNLFL